MRKHWLIVLGVALVAAGVLSGVLSSGDSQVPNDANIGGGILVMAGLFALFVGLIHAWASRRSARPPSPD